MDQESGLIITGLQGLHTNGYSYFKGISVRITYNGLKAISKQIIK